MSRREQLTEDFYLHDFYLARHRENLRMMQETYGSESPEAEEARKLVRAVEDTMIDIGGELGRMKRPY